MTGKRGSYSGSPPDTGEKGTGGVADVVAAYGTWSTHRTLDPVRGAALAAAVDAYVLDPGLTDVDYVAVILAIAARFEAYLTGGQEANDPTASS
jgi:hypothetical protein